MNFRQKQIHSSRSAFIALAVLALLVGTYLIILHFDNGVTVLAALEQEPSADADVYSRMALDIDGDFKTPFKYRLAAPAVVYFLFEDVQFGFTVLALLALALSVVVIYIFVLQATNIIWIALLTATVFMVSRFVAYNTFDVYVGAVDAMGFLFFLMASFLIINRQFLIASMVLVIGMLFKESVAMAVPFAVTWYGVQCLRDRVKPSGSIIIGMTILVAAAVVGWLAPRIIVMLLNDRSTLDVLPGVADGGIRYVVDRRLSNPDFELFDLYRTFSVLWLLIFVTVIRRHPIILAVSGAILPFLLLWFIVTDASRLLGWSWIAVSFVIIVSLTQYRIRIYTLGLLVVFIAESLILNFGLFSGYGASRLEILFSATILAVVMIVSLAVVANSMTATGNTNPFSRTR